MSSDFLAQRIELFMDLARRAEQQTGNRLYVVAATKTRTAEEINRAISLGIEIIGENRAQEFRDKAPHVLPSAQKHFIGHLQQNKLKYVVGTASLIHSCDSVELASAVSDYARRMGVVQDMLIEINISGEEQKHGFLAGQVHDAVCQLKGLENVRFRGLMTVLPHVDDVQLRPYCVQMKRLYDELKEQVFGEDFQYLSMGMSEDYEVAVECGANMIRIGRGIFGERR